MRGDRRGDVARRAANEDVGRALMREIAHLGDAVVGGQPGPGWIKLAQDDTRWRVWLTEPGRQQCEVWRGV